MPNMSAQEKSSRGLALSASDIQELLKDPNSWVAKLYAECQAIAAINQTAFIRFVEYIMLEEKFVRDQERADMRAAADARIDARQQLIDAHHPKGAPRVEAATPEKIPLPALTVMLMKEKEELVQIDQTRMSAPELAAHHQKLTNNLNHQVLAELGTVVVAEDGSERRVIELADDIQLNVPQLSARPAPSVDQVLMHNPVLAEEVINAQPEAQVAFARVFALAEDPRFVIRMAGQIREENGVELPAIQMLKLSKMVDIIREQVRENNLDLAEKIFENVDLAVKKFITDQYRPDVIALPSSPDFASLSKPPAMFGNRVKPDDSPAPGPRETPAGPKKQK